MFVDDCCFNQEIQWERKCIMQFEFLLQCLVRNTPLLGSELGMVQPNWWVSEVSTIFYLHSAQIILDSDVEKPVVSALKALVYFLRLEDTNEPTSVCTIAICFADYKPALASPLRPRQIVLILSE